MCFLFFYHYTFYFYCLYSGCAKRFVTKKSEYLQKLVVARIVTFNARRGGEVSKLTWVVWEGVEDDRWKQFFLSSSIVLQVSQTHLVDKGEYAFFRESISTFQPIVLRQVLS